MRFVFFARTDDAAAVDVIVAVAVVVVVVCDVVPERFVDDVDFRMRNNLLKCPD